jgi:hypothetical protein
VVAEYRWMAAFPAGIHTPASTANVAAKYHALRVLAFYREPKTQLRRSIFLGFPAHPLDRTTKPLILQIFSNHSVHATWISALWFWYGKIITYIGSWIFCRHTIGTMSTGWPAVHCTMLTDSHSLCTSFCIRNMHFGPLVQIQQIENIDSWIWYTNRIRIWDGLWPAVYRWMAAFPADIHTAASSANVAAKYHALWVLAFYREPKTQLQLPNFPGFPAHLLDRTTKPLILEVSSNDPVHATWISALWFSYRKMNTYIVSFICCRLTIEIMSTLWPADHRTMHTDFRSFCTSFRIPNINFVTLVHILQNKHIDSRIFYKNRIGISDGLWPAVYR